MNETRKPVAILVPDVVGCSRLAGADEERTLARLRGLRSDLIDPAIAAHHGRIVKRTGDDRIMEFAASSTRCDARSKYRTASSSATAGCGPNVVRNVERPGRNAVGVETSSPRNARRTGCSQVRESLRSLAQKWVDECPAKVVVQTWRK